MILEKLKKCKNKNDFADLLKSEDACYRLLREVRWPDGVRCPFCKSKKIHPLPKYRRYVCNNCRKLFSDTKGTIFEKTKIPLRIWFGILFEFKSRNFYTARTAKRDWNLTYKTTWFILHRLRELDKVRIDDIDQSTGIHEIDIAFIRPEFLRVPKRERSLAKGPGDNYPVLTSISRGERAVFTPLPKPASSTDVLDVVSKLMSPNSIFAFSDMDPKFVRLKTYFTDYRQFNHSRSQRGDKIHKWHHTNSVEGATRHFKKMLSEYISISRKYLHRYCGEFCGRYYMQSNIGLDCRNEAIGKFLSALQNMENPITLNTLKEEGQRAFQYIHSKRHVPHSRQISDQ